SALYTQHEKLEELTNKCRDLSDQLDQDVNSIVGSMGEISESTNATEQRAKVVHDLLTNVITFCSANSALDAAGLKTLVGILEKTATAFHDLNDNVESTNKNTELINQHITDIKDLVVNINNTLADAVSKK
ncbi:MAG: (4Fe-4S)-binding protein, partial [Ruminococcus sp.]|nr:(4Fe-4S)-binding protein [Ruminococcus sp.]